MSTQELVTSIVAEQEVSADQFINIIQQKIEDAIEVKRIELASQMFAEASKKCPECGKADCECDDEDYEDEEEDDEEEMKEEAEQIDEISKGAAIRAAGVAGSNDDPRTNRIIDRIHKKFGSKASDDAAAHANASYYGRDGKSRGTDPLNSVLDRPSQMRKTKAGKINKQDQKALATSIKGRMKMHGGKSPLPEEAELAEAFVIHKGKHEPGTKSSLGGQTLHGVSVKDVYTDKKEAQAHADKINVGRGYKPGDEKNSLYGGVLYQVSPRKKMDEMAPPGAKYERMVKHIKKGYSKDGLTKNEKSIAYATAWKAKGREMSEAAMTDAQKMAALGMKGVDRVKTMQAVSAYRKHGDINKLSAGHRSLVSSYMEKTGGLEAVNRSAASQALKKERMQEE